MKLILDKVEVDIQNFDNQNLRHEREGEGVDLEREGEVVALQRDIMAETTTSQHRGRILWEPLDRIQESVTVGTMTLESLASVFENL